MRNKYFVVIGIVRFGKSLLFKTVTKENNMIESNNASIGNVRALPKPHTFERSIRVFRKIVAGGEG